MNMSIATAPKEKRPMIHISMEQNVFERISELVDPDKPVEVYRNLHKKCWRMSSSRFRRRDVNVY